MGLSLRPERLKRYKEIAGILFKYGRSDLVTRAGLEEMLSGDALEVPPGAPDPQELPKDLETLGPAFIKLGQVLSTRADLLPQPYLLALGRLQDQVEPFPFADVQVVVEQEIGVRLSKAFDFFDEKPIAAASLGQVHRAALRDGRLVAVKVQRPDIREAVTSNLQAMEDIADFLDRHTAAGRQFAFVEMVQEFRRSLFQELWLAFTILTSDHAPKRKR